MDGDQIRAKRYSKIKFRITFANIGTTFAFLIFMLASGASISLSNAAARWTSGIYAQIGLYLLMFGVIFYIITFSLDLYGGFVVEHRFSLSNQTFWGWLKKSLKKELLSLAILLLVFELIYIFLRRFPATWWLWAAAGWVALLIIIGKVTPVFLIPLFYKCKPLANKELRSRLLELSVSCGCPIKEVFEINLSKDTKCANAGLVGMGNPRRIILSDTLMNNYSTEEIEAVLAHELGHLRLLHLWKLLGFGAGLTLAGFYLTYRFLERMVDLFGFAQVSDIAAFPLLALILMIFGVIVMPIQNGISRHFEREADRFALERTGRTQPFISAMTKLARQNLRDPSPNRFVELVLYDHPPISKRISYAEGFGASKVSTD